MNAAVCQPRRHAITATEYLRMGETGVFGPEARLELIEGEIVEMPPIGTMHAGMVTRLNRLLSKLVGEQALVTVQNPAVLSALSVPQPDLALLRPRADDYMRAHPTPADIQLLVEVADTTLNYDLGTKVPLYAASGVSEVWVVDINERAVRVFRDPSANGYRSSHTAGADDSLDCQRLPGLRVSLRELFA